MANGGSSRPSRFSRTRKPRAAEARRGEVRSTVTARCQVGVRVPERDAGRDAAREKVSPRGSCYAESATPWSTGTEASPQAVRPVRTHSCPTRLQRDTHAGGVNRNHSAKASPESIPRKHGVTSTWRREWSMERVEYRAIQFVSYPISYPTAVQTTFDTFDTEVRSSSLMCSGAHSLLLLLSPRPPSPPLLLYMCVQYFTRSDRMQVQRQCPNAGDAWPRVSVSPSFVSTPL
ncbi:hypothetical protein C7974DRAFT_85933 [Boeremia exigua]|uniref:uncharacterized protein n=1 Tax=Boeremia exigua TaxID=749465 RepID=UPI001E8E936B|nr:uncharacterized protein C7974DRAFT_85933 [Boeremia exigua]KAH6611863.1 hypothetical protein C7974DRAFT_85933 [Boeremia exigua]